MSVDPGDVERMVELAGLRLGPEDLERLGREVGGILEHMDVLARVDAVAASDPAGPEPPEGPTQGAVGAEARMEPDRLEHPPEAQAPAWREGFFLVPRLPSMDGGEGDRAGSSGP